jgi:hypothetical protein
MSHTYKCRVRSSPRAVVSISRTLLLLIFLDKALHRNKLIDLSDCHSCAFVPTPNLSISCGRIHNDARHVALFRVFSCGPPGRSRSRHMRRRLGAVTVVFRSDRLQSEYCVVCLVGNWVRTGICRPRHSSLGDPETSELKECGEEPCTIVMITTLPKLTAALPVMSRPPSPTNCIVWCRGPLLFVSARRNSSLVSEGVVLLVRT